jgi:hypothetical protein
MKKTATVSVNLKTVLRRSWKPENSIPGQAAVISAPEILAAAEIGCLNRCSF